MTKAFPLRVALAAWLLAAAPLAFAQQPAKAPATPHALPTEAREWKNDFDAIVERRHVRVLVPYNRTLYFNDKGATDRRRLRPLRAVHQQKYAKQLGKRPITVYMA
jgi:hypothetical protein